MCESVDHWRFKNRSQTLLVFVSKNLSTSLNKAVKNRYSDNNNSFKVYKHRVDSSDNTIFLWVNISSVVKGVSAIISHCLKLEFAPDPSVNFLFWSTQLIPGSSRLPSDSKYRRNICMKITNGNHHELCKTTDFHKLPMESCICKHCEQQATWSHICGI